MLNTILSRNKFSKNDIIQILQTKDSEELELLVKHSQKILKKHSSEKVFLRGLVEISNNCECDCFYCGIRKSNKSVRRFFLDEYEVINQAKWCAKNGFASFVIQSGEIKNELFISKIENIIKKIKQETKSDKQPDGLGITISLGEHTKENYQRFFDAGAHRYLLRIESSNRELYEKIHPPEQLFDNRIKCLKSLKEIGYQVGTGVMIGLPGQTIEDLANDILFFQDMDIDMLGMGPFIVHKQTPFAEYYDENQKSKKEIFQLSLNMIAAARIVLKDVNIASTTALQAMYQDGREQGLNYGANVLMPMLTPSSVRKDYMLYEGKPNLNEGAVECIECLEESIEKLNRKIGFYDYGDSRHFYNRRKP